MSSDLDIGFKKTSKELLLRNSTYSARVIVVYRTPAVPNSDLPIQNPKSTFCVQRITTSPFQHSSFHWFLPIEWWIRWIFVLQLYETRIVRHTSRRENFVRAHWFILFLPHLCWNGGRGLYMYWDIFPKFVNQCNRLKVKRRDHSGGLQREKILAGSGPLVGTSSSRSWAEISRFG